MVCLANYKKHVRFPVSLFQMASSVPLTEDQRTRFVNRELADDLANILATVILWGSNKPQNQTLKDYLTIERKKTRKEIKDCFRTATDRDKLNKDSFDGLDVTFLSALLPLMCDGIESKGKWKEANDDSRLEFHLNKITGIRNSVAHEAQGAAVDKNLVNEVETTALKVLDIAGAKYNKRTDEINAAKDETRKRMSAINEIMTEEGNVNFFQKRMLNQGILDMRQKVNASKGSASPYFEHIKSFCCPQLTYKENGTEKTISCEDIFTHATAKNARILVIEGPSGAGKSYLTNEIRADILQETGKKTFKGSDEFNTPLLFECRKRTCETIADFASEEFPCLGATSTEKGLTEKVLSGMKSILLIDGIDEVNEKSGTMLENIFVFLKNDRKTFCIFTSRPFSAEKIRKELKEEGLFNFQTLALKKLSSQDEQMKFLTTITSEKGKDISSAYKISGLKLESPVLLAVYSYLFLNKPDSLKNCKSDVHIMSEWINCGLDVLQRRLRQRKILDWEDVSSIILKNIFFISFHCLVKDQLDIGENEIHWLKGRIKEACCFKDIAPHEILSCFFVNSSDKSKDEKLCYDHKSLQEIMSARYVAEQMKRGKSFEQVITDAQEYDCLSQSSLPRGPMK